MQIQKTNRFIKGFTSRATATTVAIVMMLSSLVTMAMLISIVMAETPPLISEATPHTARYRKFNAGDTHTLGIRIDGSLGAWGTNDGGCLGQGDDFGDYEEACCCYGGTRWRQYPNSLFPVQVGTHTDWIDIAAGGTHSLGIRADGTLWAWGHNGYGQLGIGIGEGISYTSDWGTLEFYSKSSPVQVGTDTNWKNIYAGWFYSLGIRTDGTLWAWGENTGGILGVGEGELDRWGWFSGENKPSPVQVGTDTDWAIASAGNTHSLGIKTDGSLWAWGPNASYLGLGEDGYGWVETCTCCGEYEWWERPPAVTSPAQVGTHTDWEQALSGRGHSVGLRDGKLFTWGRNGYGQLGHGDKNESVHTNETDRHTPTQVGTRSDWVSIGLGNFHSFGIRADGTLWSWGMNCCGELGIGEGEDLWYETDYYGQKFIRWYDQTLPVQVGTDTNWLHVDGGWQHGLGLRFDGSLWGWGFNRDGQLGIGEYGHFDEGHWMGPRWILYDVRTPIGPTPEQLEPLPKDPPPDLSQVEIVKDDDNKVFIDIDEERIEDEKLTFRWWRRVGNGEWEELDVPPNQPWVDIELDDDDDVTYKVDIYVDNEFLLARERIFNALPPPPTPQNRFYGFAIPTAIAICIAFVCLITLIVIIIVRRREEQKNKAKIKKA